MDKEIVGQDSLQQSMERRQELGGATRRALMAAGAVGLVLTGMVIAPMVVSGRTTVEEPQVALVEPTPVAVAPAPPSAADRERADAIALRVSATQSADLDALARSVTALEQLLPRQEGRDAALTENELGLGKRVLGQANKDSVLIGEAVEHYRHAIATFEAETDASAATVRWNLAIALRLYGEYAKNNAVLREAASLFRDLLADPAAAFDRKAANMNLGLLLLALAQADNNVRLYEEAAAALDAALAGAGSDDRPRLEWAETQNALANALEALGEREWSLERLESALKARRNAWVLYQSAGLDAYQFYFDTRIAAVEDLIAAHRAAPFGEDAAAEPAT